MIYFLLIWANCLPQEIGFFASGYVYDSITKNPMVNVNISIAGSTRGVTTNSDGYFEIKIQTRRAVLYLSYMGYGIKEFSIDESSKMPLKIFLSPEVQEIAEVYIYSDADGVYKLLQGDSLDVLDYELTKDRLLIVANPLKEPERQRIYLATLSGYILSYRDLKDIGKRLDFAEEPSPKTYYLFKDMYGEVQLLTKSKVWQIYVNDDQIFLLYPTSYDICMHNLFPIKCRLNDHLYFQYSDDKENTIYFIFKQKTEQKFHGIFTMNIS